MAGYVVVGTQWGDEGKGKIVDFLAERADLVARFQGGNNAGHTIKLGNDQIILHLVPSGVLHPGKQCLIGNGVVADPKVLLEEIDLLAQRNLDLTDRLKVSRGAHVIMPYHKALDLAQEEYRGGKKLGTTGRGIGPAYADKFDRTGIRMGDLVTPAALKERLEQVLPLKNAILSKVFNKQPFDLTQLFEEYSEYGTRLKGFVVDTIPVINNAIESGGNVLFEGAQGTMLDVDHGTYPFVTSSNTVVGGVCTGLGIGCKSIRKVIGIVKAYTTRVGEGPFVTELKDEVGTRLRDVGHEYGATTGRPRRCGWLDAVQLRKAVLVNGITDVVITKLDVLTGLESIKICTKYKSDGKELVLFPTDLHVLTRCEPVYEYLAGWTDSITDARRIRDLPDTAKEYLRRISELINCKISIVSVGPERNQTIVLSSLF